MRPLQTDLSIFDKFEFEKQPVGVKFLFNKPEGIERLDKRLALCEMPKEARQRGTAFYMDGENEDCGGKIPLGMEETPPNAEFGKIGIKIEAFQEPRANSRLYNNLPKFTKGVVNYVAFSPLDKLTFEPDLLILTAIPRQAEIVLRSMSYSTGEAWESKAAPVLACAWLFVYPFKSGKVNFQFEGLGFGKIAREVSEPGSITISIPWDWIPTITHNLQEMKWVPPGFTDGREKFVQRFYGIMGELEQELRNP
jgi:uncharacterized protein (DUF169 family)